jgi:hypothetical protein
LKCEFSASLRDGIWQALISSVSRRGWLILDKKISSPIPEPIAQLLRRLDELRSTRPHRTKLPEAVWQAAVELAREHGLYSVAHPLRLDYTQLKKRLLDGVVAPPKKSSTSAFVELIASPPAAVSECTIEFESAIGSKMRIQWKSSAAPDWTSLLRAWREAER